MAFELIQQPAPGQQLADTIRRIQTFRKMAVMAQLQERLVGAQVQQVENANARAPLELTALEERIRSSRADTEGRELSTAQARRRAQLEEETRTQYRMGAGLLNDAAARGTDPGSEAFARTYQDALSRMTDDDARIQLHQEFTRLTTAARQQVADREAQRVRESRKGYAIEHPREAALVDQFGQSGAVSLINAARDRADRALRQKATMSSIQERYAIGDNLLRGIVSRAGALEDEHPNASAVPISSDILPGLAAFFLPERAVSRLEPRLQRTGASAPQIQYRNYEDQFKHSFAVFYPRAAQRIFDNLGESYWSQPGDPVEVRAQKRRDREALVQIVGAVRAGQMPRAVLDRMLIARLGDPSLQLEFNNALDDENQAQQEAGEESGVFAPYLQPRAPRP